MSDVIRRGQEAQRLLNEPLLKEAFDGVRLRILDEIEKSDVTDVELQHELALCLQSLKSVRKFLENYVRDGQLEADREEGLSRWKTFMKRTGVTPNA